MAPRLLIGTLLAVSLVTGCAAGPNFSAPPPPTVDRFTPASLPATTVDTLQRFQIDGPVAAQWWTLFGSPPLNALEDEALRANPDLKAAQAALRQARELYLAQRGSLFPAVNFAATATRARNSATIAPLLANNSNSYTLFQPQLNLTYDFDVFGGLKRQLESVAAQAEMQRFQTEAAYLTLTTNVANAALAMAGLQAQLDATAAIIAADRRTVVLTRQQQVLGEAATSDLAAAEVPLEQAEQMAPPLRQQINQQRDLLAALIGRASADAPATPIALGDLRLPAELPVSLPANLVRQRPDVLAAEANLHMASAQVGVAAAARLPDFTLNGQLGSASSTLGALLSANNVFATIAGGVTQSVFDAGTLRHRHKAAEAALDQAKEQYRSTVLAAFQHTADTLQAIVEDAEAYRHALAADAAAGYALRLARDQFTAGEAGILPLLTAQTAFAQAEVTLAQTRTARYTDTVALFQALGGGWWNDPDHISAAPR